MSIGYDKLSLNHQLLLGLTFEEMTGVITHDRAKPVHLCTLTGVPTWNSLGNGLPYLDYNRGTPDYLDCPAADTGDLDFTTEDFSGVIWVSPDDVGNTKYLMCRGVQGTGGWSFLLFFDGIWLLTHQVAATQDSNSLLIITATEWSLCGFTRIGGSVRIFWNGQDRTTTVGAHVEPDAVNLDLNVGINNDKASDAFDGRMAGGPCGPRIWGRALAAWEHLEIFNMERHWLGV